MLEDPLVVGYLVLHAHRLELGRLVPAQVESESKS